MNNYQIDLTDVTFLIPLRIDSGDRMENLNLVLEYIESNFNTTIKVLEADKQEQVSHHPAINKKIFIEDHDPVFHRTKYLNQLTRDSTTSIIAIWDTDVLFNPNQVIDAVHQLRGYQADMVFPYDGRFFITSPIFKTLYQQTKDICVFEENTGKFILPFGKNSVGGAFLANREAYVNAGMENENFYGWGAEDVERVKRWEILGYNVQRIRGPLFHLHHQSSWYHSKALEYNNRRELIRICSLNRKDLVKKIKSTAIKPTGSSLRIGLVVIATGEYYEMALSMISSARRLFFKYDMVRFFIFSDQNVPEREDLHLIRIEDEAWPLPTLKKFHYLYNHRHLLQSMDYLFLCDADMLFVEQIGREILPEKAPFLVGTQHPGYYNDSPMKDMKRPFENHPLSTAYVAPGEGKVYFAGGFNGGRKEDFLQMARTIKDNIDKDLSKGHIAIWHDESHINRYYLDHSPKLLPPGYCYPESWKLPFPKKLLALDKNNAAKRNKVI